MIAQLRLSAIRFLPVRESAEASFLLTPFPEPIREWSHQEVKRWLLDNQCSVIEDQWKNVTGLMLSGFTKADLTEKFNDPILAANILAAVRSLKEFSQAIAPATSGSLFCSVGLSAGLSAGLSVCLHVCLSVSANSFLADSAVAFKCKSAARSHLLCYASRPSYITLRADIAAVFPGLQIYIKLAGGAWTKLLSYAETGLPWNAASFTTSEDLGRRTYRIKCGTKTPESSQEKSSLLSRQPQQGPVPPRIPQEGVQIGETLTLLR
jgi:hypothetical protein